MLTSSLYICIQFVTFAHDEDDVNKLQMYDCSSNRLLVLLYILYKESFSTIISIHNQCEFVYGIRQLIIFCILTVGLDSITWQINDSISATLLCFYGELYRYLSVALMTVLLMKCFAVDVDASMINILCWLITTKDTYYTIPKKSNLPSYMTVLLVRCMLYFNLCFKPTLVHNTNF